MPMPLKTRSFLRKLRALGAGAAARVLARSWVLPAGWCGLRSDGGGGLRAAGRVLRGGL